MLWTAVFKQQLERVCNVKVLKTVQYMAYKTDYYCINNITTVSKKIQNLYSYQFIQMF